VKKESLYLNMMSILLNKLLNMKELLCEALNLLYTLEDRTDYENEKLGIAINNLQELLPTIDKLPK
jgi:hypothetical protein